MRQKIDPPKHDQDELVHYDDAVIGKAFRWSFVAFILILAGAIGTVLYIKRKPKPKPEQITSITAPETRVQAGAATPVVKFSDVTTNAGIRFVHVNGAYGDKLLPETMGGGVAFLDFDNDGDQDLLFINSTLWPWKQPEGARPATSALYRNDGKGRFEDVTAGSGLDVSLYGMGCAVGDFDNDGFTDVFITAVGGNRLFRNDGGGKFSDVTEAAGAGGDPKGWSSAAAFVDFDNDGDLDLFVGNYVKWSREIDFEVGYKLVGVGRAYGQPTNFEGTFPVLFRNDGGKFTDVSAASGVQVKNPATGLAMAKTLGVAPIDLDRDGWIDLVIANDTVQNFVFHNQRDGAFKEIGARSGVAFDGYGATRGAMGIDAGWYRNDDAIGVVIGNFANEMTALYVSQGKPFPFTDEAIAEGIGPASRLLLKFGVFFFDYDLDGRLDVLSANGHLEEEITKVQKSQQYAQPAQLFWNTGNGFKSVQPEMAGADLFKPIVGRGSAFGDIDGDGDLDAVLTQVGGPPLVVRNDQALGHSWVRLKLVGQKSNRSAIGAVVKLRVGGETITRQVMPARSYLSQSELPVTIGLGKNTKIDSAEIVWPGGVVQKLAPDAIALNRQTTITENR